MTLHEYLDQFVEGYLFCDLRSMADIRVPDGQKYGLAGYPMVAATLAGIEVLGVLSSQAPVNLFAGRARFAEFWRDYLYCGDPEREVLADLVYTLIRNPLMHTFMTKPTIIVTKQHHHQHLRRTRDERIVVDALSFADELVAAYSERLKPLISGPFEQQMTLRFTELRQAYTDDFEKNRRAIEQWPASLVGFAFDPGASSTVSSATTSPSMNRVYSTNVTGVPKLD